MAKVQHQFRAVKVNFKTRNSSKESYILKDAYKYGFKIIRLEIKVTCDVSAHTVFLRPTTAKVHDCMDDRLRTTKHRIKFINRQANFI